MAKRVAINGFGRIGRLFFRAVYDNFLNDIDIVSINDLFEPKYLAYALKYDSVFGKFKGKVDSTENSLIIDGKNIPITAERDPANLPHARNNIDVAAECTGRFVNREGASNHLTAGAKRVLISAPATDPDITVVLGCNEDKITNEHKIISNASCTTNCLAPVVKVLQDNFKIKYGLMTTIHSYTNDQSTGDMARAGTPDKMIRGRASAANMIPTSTGAAKAIGLVFPELKGKLDGIAVRVPTLDGSVVDLKAVVENRCTAADINAKMQEASNGALKGILDYTDDPIVSSDIIGNPHSSIFNGLWTKVVEDQIFVLSWYDNEWGFSNRMAELIVKKL
ncbi:MAG: type I glyceraldehyde-3-phosphate dehydrogenase [Candidatus Lokiarchaeota archaeon]|nr:type I glyceraldehyde-3-phosphate dehydrogenase [Candidatus Lokiarchaeota archaeon]